MSDVLDFQPGTQFRVTLNELNAEAASGSGGTYNWVNMLDITPGIPGYVNYMHFDLESSATASQQNCAIRVFVDGEGSPSLFFDLAGILGMNSGASFSNTTGKWSTRHVDFAADSTTGGNGTYNFRFPIPFTSSIQVQFGVSNDAAINLWSDIGYRTGMPALGYKLISQCQTVYDAINVAGAIAVGTVGTNGAINATSAVFTGSGFTSGIVGERFVALGAGPTLNDSTNGSLYTTVASFTSSTSITLANTASNTISSNGVYKYGTDNQANGTTTFLNLASGSGIAVWHGVTFAASSPPTNGALTFMENNLVWYLNGKTPLVNGGLPVGGTGGGNNPDIDTNGTEDYFMGGYYFGATPSAPWQQNECVAVSSLGTSTTGILTAGIDLWEALGGISWTNGVLCRWEQGPRLQPGTSVTAAYAAWLILYYVPYA